MLVMSLTQASEREIQHAQSRMCILSRDTQACVRVLLIRADEDCARPSARADASGFEPRPAQAN